MSTSFDRRNWLATKSSLPADRVRFLSEADASVIDSIQNGILFLMAYWSGTSVLAFSKLAEVVSALLPEEFEFVVADVDGSSALCVVPEFLGKVHGYGETAWIHQGKIIATSGLGLNFECFQPNTSILLTLARCAREGNNASTAEIAANFSWLRPWEKLKLSSGSDLDFAREVLAAYGPSDWKFTAVARRRDRDDFLFEIDNSELVAVVRLNSGRLENGSHREELTLFKHWQSWVDRCLLPDHREFRNMPV
ncbi:hypothetical protein [Planctomicrobium piriforme]|uniref:Uncharacterized protein n=1 Tax=Planctomicrobium piriforme TaxID=1576369 RepID=A0A1I3RK89_9PLAN|nr:hypothetical protein [Planctomicrobium piriforme]SFJ46149.1 hypothetical protein SAMN05421753_12112 [Planctomicrobium piriforme]